MKPVVFHPEAEEELHSAAAYYEHCSEGLGTRFLLVVQRGIDVVASAPRQAPVLVGEVRRRLPRPFPYGLLYRERADQIVILAVMHLRREPGAWKSRLPNS